MQIQCLFEMMFEEGDEFPSHGPNKPYLEVRWTDILPSFNHIVQAVMAEAELESGDPSSW